MALLLHLMPIHAELCITTLPIHAPHKLKTAQPGLHQRQSALCASPNLCSTSALLSCAMLCCAVLCCAVIIPAGIWSLTPPHLSATLCHAENGRCTRRGSQNAQGQDSCSLHHRQCTCKSLCVLSAVCTQHPCTTVKPMHDFSGNLFCM